ncbi:MAG: nucleoside kinase [Herbinix sp.]|jgi:broad-specificity NMP kinase|nr:nucleoside kinase [Herbinix sp.]
MEPTKKQQLFVITGASGVGKSTVSEILFKNEKEYIIMESDLLWNNIYNTPQNNYREYRELWLKVCCNISQIGLPVVLCGCVTPEQFELCDARKFFKDIHYIAVVSDNTVLIERMKNKRNIDDENWINSSCEFNDWLKENANKVTPNITLVDSTTLAPSEIAKIIDSHIIEILRG